MAMKTPGVYIVEKNAFPNSVVEVATAVPAFIGYTEIANNKGKSLANKPKRITSMAEYHSFFGGAPKPTFEVKEVEDQNDSNAEYDFILGEKDGTKYVLEKYTGDYLLYRSIALFYENGGGPCFIVSVGDYKADKIEAAELKDGIRPLVKEQEPTMIVIPETVLLDPGNSMTVQQAALTHCGEEMKSRVAILDVRNGDKTTEECIGAFRDSVGVNNLDFAAAYYPWLNTTIVQDSELNFENINGLESLKKLLLDEINKSSDDSSSPKSTEQKKAIADITRNWKAETDAAKEAAAKAAATAADAATKAAAAKTANEEKPADVIDAAAKNAVHAAETKKTTADAAEAAATAAKEAAKKAAEAKKASEAKPSDASLKDAAKKAADEAETAKTADEAAKAAATAAEIEDKKAAAAKAASAVKPSAATETASIEATQEAKTAKAAVEEAAKLVKKIAAEKSQLAKSLISMSPYYVKILGAIKEQLNLLPPGPAMAGIYTMVDNSRGVWKAPANVSLNAVVSPAVNITHENQEDLNVPTNGKSINAIRSFIGDGTLVWGARTLDGNSLDWRYINVRRTMIMLEESIRLAAKAYVFEPNVANTWVTIKSMIRNFLTGIWKRGGLAGAIPDDAFAVYVGLGETMTSEDILEGILRVTVLVAISRPAEFIEITFQQKMQES